jgi:hypothetical protein
LLDVKSLQSSKPTLEDVRQPVTASAGSSTLARVSGGGQPMRAGADSASLAELFRQEAVERLGTPFLASALNVEKRNAGAEEAPARSIIYKLVLAPSVNPPAKEMAHSVSVPRTLRV